jgi:hypothetical protein
MVAAATAAGDPTTAVATVAAAAAAAAEVSVFVFVVVVVVVVVVVGGFKANFDGVVKGKNGAAAATLADVAGDIMTEDKDDDDDDDTNDDNDDGDDDDDDDDIVEVTLPLPAPLLPMATLVAIESSFFLTAASAVLFAFAVKPAS